MREVSMEYVNQVREEMLETVKSPTLTHEQKVATMANKADSLLEVLNLPEGLAELKDKPIEEQCICDLFEGHAPLRPRYIIPDYQKFMKEGSKFLNLEPPKDLFEAINALEIFYRHVPSVTNFPVYVGQLDELLDPFVQDMDEELAYKLIRLFFINMDRTILDSFSHGNIGPKDTKAGRIILRVIADTCDAVPNMTMKYSEKETSDEFGLLCVKAALASAKPSFANHEMFSREFAQWEGEDARHSDVTSSQARGGDRGPALSPKYVIASCYNGLKLGGGSYTLCRLILGNIAKRSSGIEDFLTKQLPYVLDIQARYMDERIRFIVEESGFFENNFLAKEGFIRRDRFSAMFGLVGLADAVDILLEKEGIEGRFGHTENATELGVRIMDVIDQFNKNHTNPYCEATDHHFLLHAQVGIASDVAVTPGTRIPIGEEPENLVDQLNVLSHFHHYFPSGTGDIFPIDMTVHRNPDYVLDIVKGSFRKNLRYMSFYSSDSDVIRITGYLVKKSEIEKLEHGENVKHDTTALGMGAKKNGHILERKVR